MYAMFAQLGLRRGVPASYAGGSAALPMAGTPPPMSAVDKARVLVWVGGDVALGGGCDVASIGLVMEVARTSMIHAAAPHFLWPFAARYAAHQLNLWPRVSLPETSPTLRWTGKVGEESVFRPRCPTEPRCPACPTASTATPATAATAAMASPTVLTFDAEGQAIDFDVWVDNLQLFLQCDSRDGVSLFDHMSGVSTAPATTAKSAVCSQWTTRDAVARLAVRSHLPPAERAHFGQYKTAKSLYHAAVARYSSPATAALSRLMLSYLFPDLAAFATVADLISHLRTSDARYRAALLT
ncbi:unnamed protein product, partial [Closterium sp. NIES-54]